MIRNNAMYNECGCCSNKSPCSTNIDARPSASHGVALMPHNIGPRHQRCCADRSLALAPRPGPSHASPSSPSPSPFLASSRSPSPAPSPSHVTYKNIVSNATAEHQGCCMYHHHHASLLIQR